MPAMKPYKGYRYMSFVIIMIVVLLIMVVWNMSDSEAYINKRNRIEKQVDNIHDKKKDAAK